MAKVHHVKKARKTKRALGIKRGQPYWWWRSRRPGQREGRLHVSLTPPRPSQTEGNPFRKALLATQERVEDAAANADKLACASAGSCDCNDALAEELREAAADVQGLAEEQEEKLGNMPEPLQNGPAGELLRQRADRCCEIAQELEAVAGDLAEDALAVFAIDWSVD